MKFWWHKTKEKKGYRFFYHLWTKDDKPIFDGHIELYWRMKTSAGFRLHFGNRGSETPLNAHFCIPFFQIYLGCNFHGLGRICEVIGFGKRRDLSLSVHGGQLWWKLWFDDDGGHNRYHNCDTWRKMWWWPFSWYRKKHRGWSCFRDGNIELNPLSAIWGCRYYNYEDIDSKLHYIYIDQFPDDGPYVVDFTLQKMTQSRRHGIWPINRSTDRGMTVKWFCDPGIPTQNHDWKGDNTLGSNVKLPLDYDPNYWDDAAGYALREQINEFRQRSNYHPPKINQ